GSVGGHSVWYRWTAPNSGTVSFDTLGSDIDTLLGVYTGNAVDQLTLVMSNDDDRTGGKRTLDSRVSFEAIANTVYSIVVDGYSASVGNFVLHYYPGSVPTAGTYFGLIESSSGYNHGSSGFLKL